MPPPLQGRVHNKAQTHTKQRHRKYVHCKHIIFAQLLNLLPYRSRTLSRSFITSQFLPRLLAVCRAVCPSSF